MKTQKKILTTNLMQVKILKKLKWKNSNPA